jgi:hypothetical protein
VRKNKTVQAVGMLDIQTETYIDGCLPIDLALQVLAAIRGKAKALNYVECAAGRALLDAYVTPKVASRVAALARAAKVPVRTE